MSPGQRCDEIVRLIDDSLKENDLELVGLRTTTCDGLPVGSATASPDTGELWNLFNLVSGLHQVA